MSNMCRHRFGFTLIEMLVVIAIIAILGSLITPAVVRLLRGGEQLADATITENLKLALVNYAKDRAALGQPRGGKSKTRDFPYLYAWYLHGGRQAAGKASLFELNDKLALADTTPLYDFLPDGDLDRASEQDFIIGPEFETPAIIANATHVANAWGHPITMRVVNQPIAANSTKYRSTHLVIRSWGSVEGDGADTSSSVTLGREDDTFWMLELGAGKWTQLWADWAEPDGQPSSLIDVDKEQYQGFYWAALDGYPNEEGFYLLTKPFPEVQALLND